MNRMFDSEDPQNPEPETAFQWVPMDVWNDDTTRIEKIWNVHAFEEEESMSFGESVTLLIALAVMIYLIYALLWPERF